MKLISLNVALFEKNNDKLNDFLSKEDADILCLQEVTKKVDSDVNKDFITKDTIDQTTPNLNESFYGPIWVLSKFEMGNFHGKDYFSFDLGGKAEFGNYIKTKYKILKAQNIFVQNHFTYITDWSNWPNEDYRGVNVVDLEIDGKKLRVLTYHGIWSKDKMGTELTLEACTKIKNIALEVSYPSIITGDFNLFPDTKSMKVFDGKFTNLCNKFDIKTTRPQSNELSSKTRNVVDYILVSEGVKVNDFKVIDSDVSDHLPLILEFEI